MTYYIYVLEETSLRVLLQMATATTILVVAQQAMPFSVESDSHESVSSTYRSNDVCGPTTEAIQPGGPFTRLHLLISSSDTETSSVTSSRECTSQYVWQIKENILLPVGSRVPVAVWQKGFVRRHEWTRYNMLRVENGSGARQDGKFDMSSRLSIV